MPRIANCNSGQVLWAALSIFGSDWIRTDALDSCFDAFSSREPVSTSLENALTDGLMHLDEFSQRIERTDRDQLKAHQMSLTERQLLQHLVRGGDVGDVEDEGNADAVLERVPLVDLAFEIELDGLAHFARQDRARGGHVGGLDGADRQDAGRRRCRR